MCLEKVFKNLLTNTSVSFKQWLFDDSAQSVATPKHQWSVDDELWLHWMRFNKEWSKIGTTKQRRRLPEWLQPASPTRMMPLCASSPHPPPRVCAVLPSVAKAVEWKAGRRRVGVWGRPSPVGPPQPRWWGVCGGVVLTPWRWGRHT